jgi:putative transposase
MRGEPSGTNGGGAQVVGVFPDGKSALMLLAARLRHIAGTKWGTHRCSDMNRLKETAAAAA